MLRSTLLLGTFLLLPLDSIGADRGGEAQGETGLRRRAADADANGDDDRWVPEDPEAEGYFNYHPSSRFGPSKWGSFSSFHIKKMSERKYWKYYRDFIEVDLYENQCGSESVRQSPIDISASAKSSSKPYRHKCQRRESITSTRNIVRL